MWKLIKRRLQPYPAKKKTATEHRTMNLTESDQKDDRVEEGGNEKKGKRG